MAHSLNMIQADCGERLSILGTEDTVWYEVAHHFIANTVYWDHPGAGWVLAAKHAKRLVEGTDGWELTFGANVFLIELAIRRCVGAVGCFLREVEFDEQPHYPSSSASHDGRWEVRFYTALAGLTHLRSPRATRSSRGT